MREEHVTPARVVGALTSSSSILTDAIGPAQHNTNVEQTSHDGRGLGSVGEAAVPRKRLREAGWRATALAARRFPSYFQRGLDTILDVGAGLGTRHQHAMSAGAATLFITARVV